LKCPICGGEAVIKEEEYKMGNEKISFDVLKCSKCKEELVFEEQAQKVFDKALEFKKKLLFKKKIGYAGNSLILRIPKKLAKSLNLREGKEVEIIAKKNGFGVNVD